MKRSWCSPAPLRAGGSRGNEQPPNCVSVTDGGAPASTSAAAVAGEEPIATPAPPILTPSVRNRWLPPRTSTGAPRTVSQRHGGPLPSDLAVGSEEAFPRGRGRGRPSKREKLTRLAHLGDAILGVSMEADTSETESMPTADSLLSSAPLYLREAEREAVATPSLSLVEIKPIVSIATPHAACALSLRQAIHEERVSGDGRRGDDGDGARPSAICRDLLAPKSGRRFVVSLGADAQLLRCDPMALARMKTRVAMAAWLRHRSTLADLRSVVRNMLDRFPTKVRVVCDINVRSYDETESRLRVGSEGAGVAKVMQIAMASALLLKIETDAVREYVLLHAKHLAALQAVERTTGECTRAALEAQDPTLYESLGGRKLHLVSTDDASSNTRCERGIRLDPPPHVGGLPTDPATLHVKCTVHKAQAVIKYAMEPISEDVSAILSLGLSMRGAGSLSVFRRVLAEELDASLRISFTPPPTEAARRRSTLLRIFTARGGRRGRRIAVVLATLVNGDWDDVGRVCHHCAPWCCVDAADTRAKFKKYVAPALAGTIFAVFARSRWNGGHRAVDQQGLLASVHGLLSVVYTKWAAIMQPADASRAPTSALGAHECGLASVLLPLADSVWRGHHGSAAPIDEGSTFPESAGVPLDAVADDTVEQWRAEQRAHRSKALTFVSDARRASDRMIILRIVMEPHVRLIDDLLYLASAQWEREQLARVTTEGRRAYRIVELGAMRLERRFLRQVRDILQQRSWPLSSTGRLTTTRSLAFRLASRMGAACVHYLQTPHSVAPFTLFAVLEDADAASAVLGTAPCMRGDFTASHIRAYPTVDQLLSPDSIETLRAVAALAEVDTVARECGHASARRVSGLRSVQTHALSFESLSADHVAAQVRAAGASWYGDASESRSPLSGAEPVAAARRKQKVGGGAWRAYVHEHGGGSALPDMKRLSREYHALPAAEMAKYTALGRAATRALRAGASRGFAVTQSQLARSTSKHAGALQPVAKDFSDDYTDLALATTTSTLNARLKTATAQCAASTRQRKEASREATAKLVAFGKSSGPCGLRAVMREMPDVAKELGATLHPLPHSVPAAIMHCRSLVSELGHAFDGVTDKKTGSLGPQLDELWARSSDVIMHDTCRPIRLALPREQCLRAGMCICTQPGKSLDLWWKGIARELKSAFPKTRDRELLTGGQLVLQFDELSAPPTDTLALAVRDSDAVETRGSSSHREARWAHLSLVSLNPLDAVVLELVNARPRGFAPGVICLDVQFNDDAPSFSNVREFLATLGVGSQWRSSVYRLLGPDEERLVYEVCAGDVEVLFSRDLGQTWPRIAARRRRLASGHAARRGRRARRAASQRAVDDEAHGGLISDSSAEDDELTDSDASVEPISDVEHAELDYLDLVDAAERGIESDGAYVGEGFSQHDEEAVGSPCGESADDAPSSGDDGRGDAVDPAASASGHSIGSELGDITDVGSGDEAPLVVPAAPLPPPLDVAPLEAPLVAAGKVPHMRVDFVDERGNAFSLRYDHVDNGFIGYCGAHAGAKCTSTRTANSGRKRGSGRPLGFMMAWMLSAHTFESKAEHKAAAVPSLEARKAARAFLRGIAGSAPMFEMEAPPEAGAESEPEVFSK